MEICYLPLNPQRDEVEISSRKIAKKHSAEAKIVILVNIMNILQLPQEHFNLSRLLKKRLGVLRVWKVAGNARL